MTTRSYDMGRGEDKLATQVGAKGYFGNVAVEAEPIDGNGEVTVEFDAAVSPRWQSGASFGIDYVLDHVAKRQLFPKGGRVHVRHIHGHEVDTNNVVIAFVAANALCKALGVEPKKRPTFDQATGVFSFPK
jgi:hypothetical protein